MTRLQRSARIGIAAAIYIAGIITIVATGSGGDPPTPPTTGSLSVNIGFGAVTSTPYQCTGTASVTITPGSLTGTDGTATAQTQNITFSRMSSTTPNEPACQETVVFSDLRPGSWTVSSGGANCPATVTAGQFPTVKIWNGACS